MRVIPKYDTDYKTEYKRECSTYYVQGCEKYYDTRYEDVCTTYIDKGTIHKGRPHRGGRWSKNRPILRTNSTTKMRKRGGRGSKIPKILRTSFMNGP